MTRASELHSILTNNLRRVADRIEAACAKSHRPQNELTLVAVTKYAELDWVRALVDLGMTDLAESRPQQLASRASTLPTNIRWHLIGHLQRNKVESVLSVTHLIHSVDSARLAVAISKAAGKLEPQGSTATPRPRVLLEVNVSGEASKDGFSPTDLLESWPDLCALPAVSIEGLMTMAPLNESAEAARPVFQSLRRLRDQLEEASGGQCRLPVLSMGMSGDFEVAIQEGATHIRIGSSLFEGLTPATPGGQTH